MNSKELYKFVKEQLDSKVSSSLVKRKLKAMSFKEKKIDETIELAKKGKEPKLVLPYINLKIAIPIALVVVIAALILFVPFKFPLQKQAAVQQTQTALFREPTQQEINALKKAAETGDTKYCNDIKEHNLYYDCLDRIWEKDNFRYLHYLINDINQYFYDKAFKEKEITICDNIKDYKKYTDCVLNISFYFFSSKDYESCSKYDACVYYLFNRFLNENLSEKFCNLMNIQVLKDHCFERLGIDYIRNFGEAEGIIFCNRIVNETIKEKCYRGY